MEARLRSSILGPIFIVLYEPHNSHQLPSTSLILHQTASDCRRYAHVGNTEFFYSSIDEIVTVIVPNQSGGSSGKSIVWLCRVYSKLLKSLFTICVLLYFKLREFNRVERRGGPISIERCNFR